MGYGLRRKIFLKEYKLSYVRIFLCISLLFVFFFLPDFPKKDSGDKVFGSPDWLDDWGNRIKLTINHELVNGDLADFPLLIYLSDSSGVNKGNLSYIFDEIGANSRKIALTTEDGLTQCNVEIDRWEAGNEKGWLWVRVPFIDSNTDTILYLYYDNSKADNPFVNITGTATAENVWLNNYLAVWHKKDQNPSQVADSTGNGNNGLKSGANEPLEADGQVGRSQIYDGINDYISVGNNSLNQQLSGTSGITFSAWINPSSFAAGGGDNRNVILDLPMEDESSAIKVYLTNNGTPVVGGMSTRDDGFHFIEYHEPLLITDSWQHIAAVLSFSGDRITAYLDGQQIMSGASVFDSNFFIPGDGGNETLGVNTALTASKYFHGSMDAVRLSDAVRSAAWIEAEYLSESDKLIKYPTFHVTGYANVKVTPVLYFSRRHVMSVSVNIENLTEDAHIFLGGVDVLNNVDPENPEKAGSKEFSTAIINGGDKTTISLMIPLDESLLIKHRFNGYANIDK